jgi:3-oxoacyl-[acyl-carrier protein] reductase
MKGRSALIAGAARGIGKAVALRLARDGCSVVLSGRDPRALEAVAAEIRQIGATAVPCAGDLRERGTPERLVEGALENFGRLDMLVNSAARAMIAADAGGRIVNLSSIAASMAMYGQAAYAAAKAGVSAPTRVMAIELAPHGITVNAVAPGPIGTEQLRAVYNDAMYRERGRGIPLNRLGEPAGRHDRFSRFARGGIHHRAGPHARRRRIGGRLLQL